MKDFLLAAASFLFLIPGISSAQTVLSDTLRWHKTPQHIQLDNRIQTWYSFDGALHDDRTPFLPYVLASVPLQGPGQLRVQVNQLLTEPITTPLPPDLVLPENLPDFQTLVEKQRQAFVGKVLFSPFFLERGKPVRVRFYSISLWWTSGSETSLRTDEFASQSVLKDGTFYKIAVTQDGMHKITYDFLKNELKLDIDKTDPRLISLWGNTNGMLPELVGASKPDDLVEIPIQLSGEADGKFESGDFILFYGQGPDSWVFRPETGRFSMRKNIYSTANYYFLKVGTTGKRLPEQSSISTTAYTARDFDDYARLEEDKRNLLHEWVKAKGSGKRWFGDQIKNVRQYTYDKFFKFPNLVTEAPVMVRAEMALRAIQSSRFALTLNGSTVYSGYADRVAELEGELDNTRDYAKNAVLDGTIKLGAENVEAVIQYLPPGGANDGSEGWVDFIELQAKRQLVFTGEQLAFRNVQSLAYPSTTFELSNTSAETQVWDISNPLQPLNQQLTRNGTTLQFGVSTTTLRQFIAFNTSRITLQPKAIGKINNQNWHALSRADMVILCPAVFRAEAAVLAAHRQQHDGLVTAVVEVEQVYNEFSGGKKDPAAIRNFARMLYLRDPGFRFLLLLGDGSFDSRDIYGFGNDWLPTYQSDSFNPLFAFPADDYYGLLEPTIGTDPLIGSLQIGLGRIPVNSIEEARAAIAKIIHYDTAPGTLSDWQNRMLFVADDEDGMQHTDAANRIADHISATVPSLNMDKVFLDAFPQVATSGGNRVPGVTDAINESIYKGALIVTYLGHGGPSGWAQERILNISDIQAWKNIDRQALFLTATCSFTNYDDPTFTSAGEEAFLNTAGGAMALLTTTRAVYANQNAVITEKSLDALFSVEDNAFPALGEALQHAKNASSFSGITTNSRKFCLIGDPAQHLAIPRFRVRTTALDTHTVTSMTMDTLRALQKVTIHGQIVDLQNNPLNQFEGILYPTVFDKTVETNTLGQDPGSYPYPYQVQKNTLFRGRSTIKGGRFSFTFLVPKDINYAFGPGKISYYASNESNRESAAGYYDQIVIGGNSLDTLADQTGPEIAVYMNNTDFVSGGTTEPNPLLLVLLNDDNGINVVGNSIGHDLEAILDENTQHTIVLNDFFTAGLDNFQQGEVRYPLKDIADGLHRIRVKAWDISNNSSEGYTEFFVASDAGVALSHVLNYPNPFTDHTCFQFDHNYANQELDVLIQIFTVSGKLVKTINQLIYSDGAIRQDNCIPWNGTDDFGDQLARGVYIYKVKVRTTQAGNQPSQGESGFEKLVILK